MRTALWISLCVLVAGFATSADARAHKPLPNPKRPPDLQGVWSYNSLTRLERPDAYSAVTIGEAEARAVRPQPFIPPDAVGQAESETYDPEGLALARVGGRIRTAWLVDPPDGRLPFTPEGRARAFKPPTFDGPEPRTNQERCLVMPGAGPPMISGLYNNNLQIVQTQDHLVIFMEMNHEVRIIPIGRRRRDGISHWMGDSVGWWEGDTFTIETTHMMPAESQRTFPLAHVYISPDAVVTERLRRVSPGQVLYSYTVVDPANYTRPWRGEMPLNRTRGAMFEYACHEGNYALPNILAGARREENAAEAQRKPGP